MLKFLSLCHVLLFFLTLHSFNANSQGIVDDISEGTLSSDVFSESIRTISRSKRIFILTNSNQSLAKGDFITLSLPNSGPVARALVAKTYQGFAGIKIMKIYSLKRWALLKKGLGIDLIKGDDSSLFKKKKEKSIAKEEEVKIEGEEDLYSDNKLIGDDTEFISKDSRHIKPDNIVSFAWGRHQFENTIDKDIETNNQFFGQWAYQFADNYWLEGVYGRTLIDNFPATNTQTLLNNFVGRFKYVFKAPLYSYIVPYIGFQQVSVSSPEAGRTNDATLAQQELDLVDSLAKSGIVAGVTVIRRMVPGWFIKADIGTDAINIGFAIEF